MDIYSSVLDIPLNLFSEFDRLWTWFLLVTRYTALFLVVPGLGSGPQGVAVRMPGILVLAFASLFSSPTSHLPGDLWLLLAAFGSELVVGALIGAVPYIVVSAAHGAGFLASTSMGLNAGQFFDHSLGVQSTELSKLYGDLFIFLMFATNAHHLIIYGASGSGQYLTPGTFVLGNATLSALVAQTGGIFLSSFMIASPVIAALFLLQVLMGMLSKAVPTINIFIVSFPVTLGVGLIVTSASLPTVMNYLAGKVTSLELMYQALLQ